MHCEPALGNHLARGRTTNGLTGVALSRLAAEEETARPRGGIGGHALPNEFPEVGDVKSRNETSVTLQPESGDHSTLDHSDTGMRARSPEVSRCCIQVCQEADSDRLRRARDQQNVHADDLQTQ